MTTDVERTKRLIRDLSKYSGWTFSKMAKEAGFAHTTLSRFMREEHPAHNLKPQTVRQIFNRVYAAKMRELSREDRDAISDILLGPRDDQRGWAFGPDAFAVFQMKLAYENWFYDSAGEPRQGAAVEKLRVVGHVQAGVFRDALEWPYDEHYFVPMPFDADDMIDVFGLEVRGNSMDLRFSEGTVLVCRRYDDEYADLPVDKYVIVQRRNGVTDDFEATCKKLSRIGDDLWLMPESSDPSHQNTRLQGGDNGDLHICAVVIGAYEKL